MKETKLYERIRPKLEKWGTCTRVENELGSGTPDVFYSIQRIGGWIETKVAKGKYIYFEKFQMPWYRRHLKVGFDRIFVVVLDDDVIKVWNARDVVRAPVESYEKWTVVHVSNLPQPACMFRLQDGSWDAFEATLIS